MLGRTQKDVLAALLTKLEVLEIEAARVIVIAKSNSEDKVLGESASLIYETVLAVREHIKELRKTNAAAGG